MHRQRQCFKQFKQKCENKSHQEAYQSKTSDKNRSSNSREERETEYESYTFNDETLKNWMHNARRQSVDLAKQTIKDLKGMVSVGFKEGAKASGEALIGQIVISILIIIILGLSKFCNS